MECDGCQKGENFISLDQSERKNVAKDFSFQHGACEMSVSLQKNEVVWKVCTQWEGQKGRQTMSQRRICDI